MRFIKIDTKRRTHMLFLELTFKTGLDFSASDLRSSRAAFCATDVRAVGAGAKAAADPAKIEIRASFMVVFSLQREIDTMVQSKKAAGATRTLS